MAEPAVRTRLPRARRLVKCNNCSRLHPEDAEGVCPATQQLTGELAGINLDRLTNRQWSGIDCALCGLWLCIPAGADTRPLGKVRNVLGYPHTLWAHSPTCGAPE